jgi:UvrD-like helicase C-terminal domain/AAA domain
MQEAAVLGGQLVTQPYQRALVMAVMHGARRHLQSTVRRHCPKLPATICTIHSFAMSIVNRWRRSLGLAFPVVVCETGCGLSEKHGCTHATFSELMILACKLLDSRAVASTLSQAYPLVVVDEFQDCVAETLQFIQALGTCSTLLLAADHFQMLNGGESGCPAVEWAQTLKEQGAIRYHDLSGCPRTDNQEILNSARALRGNTKASGPTVPVYHAPTVPMAAWRLVERFLPYKNVKKIKTGTCALIALSVDDPLLQKLLTSFHNQLAKRGCRAIHWSCQLAEAQEQKQLLAELRIDSAQTGGGTWVPPQDITSKQESRIALDVVRFAKLRGISPIPQELAARLATLALHNSRAFGWSTPQFQVLTVHGAKNREFDHVFVFWGFKSSGWSVEEQRRLLYNAVTRAKCDCTVLVMRGKKRTEDGTVLSLLGSALPAIDPTWKRKRKKP